MKIKKFYKGDKRILKGNVINYDEELLQLIGKKGIYQILKDIDKARRDRANGFMGYSAEQVIDEMEEIIKEAIALKNA